MSGVWMVTPIDIAARELVAKWRQTWAGSYATGKPEIDNVTAADLSATERCADELEAILSAPQPAEAAQAGRWVQFSERWPKESAALDNPTVKARDCVMVTNNIKGRDRMGRMANVWFAVPRQSDDGTVCAFTETGRKLHGLTHWFDPFAHPSPSPFDDAAAKRALKAIDNVIRYRLTDGDAWMRAITEARDYFAALTAAGGAGPKCICDGADYAPNQKHPFIVNRSCPIHAAQPAAAVPEGWRIRRDGRSIHVVTPDGSGYYCEPSDRVDSRQHVLYLLCAAILAAPPQPEGNDDGR